MKQLIVPNGNASRGGSGFGVSFYLPYLGCPRRDHLDDTAEAAEGKLALGAIPTALRPTDRYGKPRLDQRKVGLLFHKLMEFYHTRQMDQCELLYEDGPEDLEWQEVLRLFKAYRAKYPPDHFGAVLSVEESFMLGCPKCLNAGVGVAEGAPLHEGQDVAGQPCAEARACLRLLGVPVFTGRLDMKCQIATEAQRDYWLGQGLVCNVGDIVYVDTKTKKRNDNYMADWAAVNTQFHSYVMAGEVRGEGPVGMVASVVASTKDPTLITIPVPPPTDTDRLVVKQMLAEANRVRMERGPMWANPARCFDYFKTCPFLGNKCNRTNQ